MEEPQFYANNKTESYIVKLLVAGGGMMNGNAYAEVEAHYKNEEDWNNGEDAVDIYYCEYGKNPCRDWIGEWDDEGFIFIEDGIFNILEMIRDI